MTNEDLKALRKHLGLTQQAFADSIGTDRHMISHWEAGRHKISKAYQQIITTKYRKELKQL